MRSTENVTDLLGLLDMAMALTGLAEHALHCCGFPVATAVSI